MRTSLCFSVYATTAANAKESSYACYYDEKRDTYLGDWYSVNWMEDSDVVGDVSPVVIEMKNLFVSFCASNVNRAYLYSFDSLR